MAPQKAPPVGRLFAPAASSASRTGPDLAPGAEPLPEPARVPRWEAQADAVALGREGSGVEGSEVEAAQEAAEEAIELDEAIERCVLPGLSLTLTLTFT